MARAANGTTVVTGASGSIGRATVRALAARGCSVVTVDRRPLRGPEASLAAKHLAVDLEEARRFSRSFLQRAQATAGPTSMIRSRGGNGFAEKAFASVWRSLDEELAKEEPYLRSPR